MSIRLLTCVWIAVLVQAQNPCRVNVIFSLEASTYVNSEGESIVYDQISKVQSAYQSWTISPNSVRAALPKPIGCTQGGNWNLQNDTNSLNNAVSSVKRFLYTCFQPNSLSDYITSLNNQILQSQSVDPANYVFVIFTATTDTNDVQKAISLRTQFFDPKGYGLVVVKVEPQTASNLAQFATNGVYDLGDPIFTQDISSAVCNGKTVGSTVSSSTSIVTTSSTPSYSCGNGSWTLVENRCLSFESTQKEWTAASRYCHSLGGVLVTIFDNKDEDFLYSNADTVAFFIGLNDIVKNDTWLWDQPTGQTLSLNDTKYANWASGQPIINSDPYNRCVMDEKDVGWTVTSCFDEHFFACEKPAGIKIDIKSSIDELKNIKNETFSRITEDIGKQLDIIIEDIKNDALSKKEVQRTITLILIAIAIHVVFSVIVLVYIGVSCYVMIYKQRVFSEDLIAKKEKLDESNDYETIDDLPQAKNQPVKDIESSYSKINQSIKNHSSSKSSNPTKSALNTPLSNGRNNSNDSNSSTGFENALLRLYSKISPLKCFLFILLICILIIVAIVITVVVIIHKHPQESIMHNTNTVITVRPTTTTS